MRCDSEMPRSDSGMMVGATKLDMFGTTWHKGKGAKDAMKATAVARGHECMVQLQDPDSGARHFGSYGTWDDALKQLRRLKGHKRHLFEIIPHGRECKPYLDLDGPTPPPGAPLSTVADVIERLEGIVEWVFKNDYDVELQKHEMIWLVSPNPAKLSVHLTVSTTGEHPQYVYSSNHQEDPTGASHLAQRVRQLDPTGVGPLVDVSVYTKDREMRAIGASKFGKGGYVLEPHRPLAAGQAPRDALITCLGAASERRRLNVPGYIPRAVRTRHRELTSPHEAAEQEPGVERSAMIVRMLDLLRERVHPSAYHDRRSQESPYDAAVGVKFNHLDRSEACYTGHVHDGSQNLRCHVDAVGDVYAKCFSESCRGRPAYRLGRLKAESDMWAADAIRVDVRYLCVDECQPLGAVLERWLSGDVRALSVRSPMGSGKSTMLDAIVRRLVEADPGVTVLMVTYRQSLAMEHVRKLRAHGFVSYLDYTSDADRRSLADRVACPRVICQLESLPRLSDVRMLPRFDVVVIDESESMLRHFASPTVHAPVQAADSFMQMVRSARRGVLTLDAAWGALTWSVLRKASLTNALVVNERRPDGADVRTFVFSNDDPAWNESIADDLADGLNVVVVTLSAERAMAVHRAGCLAVGEDLCLLHTSKTGDELKRRLTDVDALWSAKRLVVYSPTIAAGVDFSAEHFDRMYLYVCAMSALPATALQMTGRVRRLRNTEVRGLLAPNVRPNQAASRPSLTSDNMAVWLRWMQDKNQSKDTPHTQERVLNGGDGPTGWRQPTLGELWHPSTEAAPATASLPPVTYWSLITSFVEAERHNAQADYLHCFAELAVAAGHRVTVDRIVAAAALSPPAEPGGITASKMLAAAPIDDDEEHERIRLRVVRNVASEDDKWRMYVASYKAGWGVDRIDGAFIEAVGTRPGSPEARLLARVLCPALRSGRPGDRDTSLTEQAGVFKVVLVSETIAALGLRSPFDVETVVPDLMAAFESTLRETPMFREYNQNARLFRQGQVVGVSGEWDLKKVSKAVNMVLGAVGLKLRATKEARPGKGATRKRSKSDYRLDPQRVAEMVELVKLRLRANGHVPDSEHARATLDACELPLYGRLVDTERDGAMPVGFAFAMVDAE